MDEETTASVRDSAEMTEKAAAHTAKAANVSATAAVQTATAAKQTKDSADRRTELAADRTVFAAERTYAAWVRTGLVALASGVGSRKLLEGVVPDWEILGTGTILILFSAFCFAAGVWRQTSPPAEPDVRRLPPHILLVVNAFLALVALTALASIWTPAP